MNISKKLIGIVKRFVKDVTEDEPMDGDETELISCLVRVELDWNNGNLTNQEYEALLNELNETGSC